MKVVMSHSDVPPSLNRLGSRGSHWGYTRAKRDWQDTITVMLLVAEIPRRLRFARIDATLRFPVKRRRDAGNFAWLLEKAAGDALVGGRWLKDDTPDQYVFGGVVFDEDLGPRQTILRLDYRL